MENNMNTKPEAHAILQGSSRYPDILGEVCFYGVHDGTVITVTVQGLPDNGSGNFFGFHIHEEGECSGTNEDPFKNAGGHFNPSNTQHPKHAGDLPVLLGNNGVAWASFYTNRFFPEDVIGRAVIIHDMADDYRSQPAGDSGMKIACGRIEEVEM